MVAPGPTTDANPVRAWLASALREQGDRLYALAWRVTRDPELARDAVQSAFAAALENADSFRGEAAVSTWLHRIVYNKAIDLLRARGREVPLPEGESEDDRLGSEDLALAHAPSWSRPDSALDARELRHRLESAFESLTPLQRAVFELREEQGLSSEQVGEALALSSGAVRVHLHRARLKLRSLLAESKPGESR